MKNILYIFDDINYQSGAQKLTMYQINVIKELYNISVFSLTKPNESIKFDGITVIGDNIWSSNEIFALSLKHVVTSKEIKSKRKLLRILFSIAIRLNREELFLEHMLYRHIREVFEKYDSVVVVSEASKLRTSVSKLVHPKKIQWVHTDYALWSEFSTWTRAITKSDAKIYNYYDNIVVLSQKSSNGMIAKLQLIQNKILTIPNMIPWEEILQKSGQESNINVDSTKINLITVGRIDKEKAFDRIIDICIRLKKEKLIFCWYIVGDGPLKQHIEHRIKKEGLEKFIIMLGKQLNPYSIMKKCDWFALLSEYEGMPATIYEAMVLEMPVIATDVGGVSEQFDNGVKGVLVRNHEEDIYEKLRMIINEEIRVEHKKNNYRSYNESIIKQLVKLL